MIFMSLWSASFLAFLLASLSFQAGVQKQAGQAEMNQFKGHWALVSGVNLAFKAIAEDPEPYRDSPQDTWYGPLALAGSWKERLSIHIEDEDSKLNLNLANEKLLREFFEGLKKESGIRFEKDAKAMAKALTAWRNQKKNKRFDFLEELLLIEEITKEDFEQFESFATVSTEDTVFPAVNINTVSEAVLKTVMASAPGDEFRKRELLQKILLARKDAISPEELEPRIFMERLQLAPSAEMTGLVSQLMPYFKTDSATFRLEVRAIPENKKAGAIIRAAGPMIQPVILFWHEE